MLLSPLLEAVIDKPGLLEKQDLRVASERPSSQIVEFKPALLWIRVPEMPAVPRHYFESRGQAAQALIQGRGCGVSAPEEDATAPSAAGGKSSSGLGLRLRCTSSGSWPL